MNLTCHDYKSQPQKDKLIWVHICLDEKGLLWDILIREEKEYRGSVTYVMDSQIYCSAQSEATFNELCFDMALDLAQKLLREYEFKEMVIEDTIDNI